MARPRTNPVDGFGFFLRFADELQRSSSIRAVSEALRTPPQTLSDTVSRLGEFFGEELISRDAVDRTLKLTNAGEILLARLRECLKPLIDNHHALKVKLAHSLTRNRLLLSVLEAFRRPKQSSDEPNLTIDYGQILDDSKEIENLLSGRSDMLMCWALPQRIGRWSSYSNLVYREIGPEYPLAIISHSIGLLAESTGSRELLQLRYPDLLPAASIDFDFLVKHKLATLSHEKQPLFDYLAERGFFFFPERRIEVTSFLEVIDAVRMKKADFGIVPMMDGELDSLQSSGELFHQEIPQAIDKRPTGLRVAAVFRTPFGPDCQADNDSKDMVNARSVKASEVVDAIVERLTSLGTWLPARAIRLAALPSNAAFYRRIRYGYYLFPPAATLGERNDSLGHVATWQSETISNFSLVAEGSGLTLERGCEAHIKNTRGELFHIEQAQLNDKALMIVAKERTPSSEKQSPSGFISVFTACVESISEVSQRPFSDSIIAGFWSGGGGSGIKQPLATWGTVFSSRELTLDSLNAIARAAARHCTLLTPFPFQGDVLNKLQ